MNFKILILIISILTSSSFVSAQDSDVEELNLIEMELDRDLRSSPVPEDKETPSETGRSTLPPTQNNLQEVRNVEDLNRLTEFQQVSIVQRRFLPRTERVQFFLAPTLTLNDPWFNVYGGTLRAAYNFREAWGIEAGYTFLSTDKSQALRELDKENNTVAKNIVFSKSYYNVDINWTPLYGKMTWLDEQILYYDTYFSAGFGGTEIQTGDVQPTVHLGVGQIFSMSKKMAFRWDLSWNFFEAKDLDARSTGAYNNVFLSAGFSFFFPEASYR